MMNNNVPTNGNNSMEDTGLEAYLNDNADRQLGELMKWLCIPSVSTQAKYREEMARAARWLSDQLEAAGLENVDIIETASHPLVYGDWLHAGDDRPTVLLYGHYDVQPPEPEEKWDTPPFEPTVRDNNLYARGTTDDKGQLFILVKALQALLDVRGKLPVNIKFIAEGDEESGGPALGPYVNANREKLAADICLVSDTHIVSPDRPCLITGLRGMWGCEVVVRGPKGDLHSGLYGGVVHNPAQALAELVAAFHDSDGRVAVPGFYDDVVDLDPVERERLAEGPQDDGVFLEETGVPVLYGEPGFTAVERVGVRPTLEVNGMWGGFTGEGFKTVIPAEARVRISCRLVSDQDPDKIGRQFAEYVRRIAPPTVSVEVIPLFGIPAVVVDPDSVAMRAAGRAYEKGFGAAPVFKREGGGIPIVLTFREVLDVRVVFLGFGLPDDNAHAPNEKIHLPNFYRGIRTVIHFFDELASGTD